MDEAMRWRAAPGQPGVRRRGAAILGLALGALLLPGHGGANIRAGFVVLLAGGGSGGFVDDRVRAGTL